MLFTNYYRLYIPVGSDKSGQYPDVLLDAGHAFFLNCQGILDSCFFYELFFFKRVVHMQADILHSLPK